MAMNATTALSFARTKASTPRLPLCQCESAHPQPDTIEREESPQASTTRLERRERRGAAHRDRAEPEATRQATRPRPTAVSSRSPSVGVASGMTMWIRRCRSSLDARRDKGSTKNPQTSPPANPDEFCNRIEDIADIGLRPGMSVYDAVDGSSTGA